MGRNRIWESGYCLQCLLQILLALLITTGRSVKAKTSLQISNEAGFIEIIEEPDSFAIGISDAAGLAAISEDLTASYVQTSDIELSDYGVWTPIGNSIVTAFQGKLDGQDHTISSFKVSYSSLVQAQ